jgi:hypothetical protein
MIFQNLLKKKKMEEDKKTVTSQLLIELQDQLDKAQFDKMSKIKIVKDAEDIASRERYNIIQVTRKINKLERLIRHEQTKDKPLIKIFIFSSYHHDTINYYCRDGGYMFFDDSGKKYPYNYLSHKYPNGSTWWVSGESFEQTIKRYRSWFKSNDQTEFVPGGITVSCTGN